MGGNPGRLGLACVCFLALLPATAMATYKGSPGKVAYIEGQGDPEPAPLKVWDPAKAGETLDDPNDGVITIEAQTYHKSTYTSTSLGYPSPPAWSPDGTRIAYTKSIDATGNCPQQIWHTAVFTYDIRNGAVHQVTQPPDCFADLDPGPPALGHDGFDVAPTWSPNGNTIAFVRTVAATPDDVDYPKEGTNLWTVNALGGNEVKITEYPGGGTQVGNALAWIPGKQELLGSTNSQQGAQMAKIGLSGAVTPIGPPANTPVLDFDASPNGERFTYSTLSGLGIEVHEGDVATGATNLVLGAQSTRVRYQDRNTLMISGCVHGVTTCGLVGHPVDPTDADVDPQADGMMLPWSETKVLGSPAPVGRMAYDIQPQTLPVIFIPGFLGSKIMCGASDTLWPDLPFENLTSMALAPSGTSNAGCSDAAPDGTIVETVLGSSVYKTTADWLRLDLDEPDGRLTLFGWDWRKEPQQSFAKLDEAITDALARPGPWKEQGVGRVVLYGHSYGGLLIRSYIAGAGGARVARVLTAGSPYWGSPKSIFPLAFGIESPLPSAMDVLINNAEMKELARNLAGLYHLYPSDKFGPWLSVNGEAQNQAGVKNFVTVLGGNYDLLGRAFTNHNTLIDGFYDRQGWIDYRVVAGAGVPTIEKFEFFVAGQGNLVVTGTLRNGDATVPLRSAAQTTSDGGTPLGDPVRVQYTCDVAHVPLPGNLKLRTAYTGFLDTGRLPFKLDATPCPAKGGWYQYESSTIGRTPARARRRASMTLDEADAAELIDLIDASPQTLVVLDEDTPVDLQFQISNGTFIYTPVPGDGTEGAKIEYGPATGTLRIVSGAAGQPPAVTLDGQELPGHPVTTPGPDPSPTPTTTPGPSPEPTASPAPAARITLVGRPRVKGKRLKATVSVNVPGRLAAKVTRKRKRLGSSTAKATAPGRRTITVKLRRRPRGKLKVTVRFVPASGQAVSVSTTVKAPR